MLKNLWIAQNQSISANSTNTTNSTNFTSTLTYPKFNLSLGEQNIPLDWLDFALNTTDGTGSCIPNFFVSWINQTGILGYPLADGILLGNQYFNRYAGMHFNFDTNRIAFIPSTQKTVDPIKPNPVDPANKPGGLSGIVIALIIIGAVVVVLGVGIFIYKKRQQSLHANLEQYGRLS